MTLKDIQDAIQKGEYQYSLHAVKRATERQISRQAIANGEIIENYPDDKYSPSCLIFGRTDENRPLHVQVSFPPHVKIIMVYEPDANEWEEYRVRKRDGT